MNRFQEIARMYGNEQELNNSYRICFLAQPLTTNVPYYRTFTIVFKPVCLNSNMTETERTFSKEENLCVVRTLSESAAE